MDLIGSGKGCGVRHEMGTEIHYTLKICWCKKAGVSRHGRGPNIPGGLGKRKIENLNRVAPLP